MSGTIEDDEKPVRKRDPLKVAKEENERMYQVVRQSGRELSRMTHTAEMLNAKYRRSQDTLKQVYTFLRQRGIEHNIVGVVYESIERDK